MRSNHIKIYHITHINNLSNIVTTDYVYSDAKRIELGFDCNLVGMSNIKKRRLEKIEVACHPNTKVGQYVPFYFCPRSVMLYLLHRGNHPDLEYTGGQEPILHLQVDFHRTVAWANQNRVRWTFSDGNAGTYYAQFYKDTDDLDKLNWKAIESTDFRDAAVKEGKQAEFLVLDQFPCTLIEKIGVVNSDMLAKVKNIVQNDIEIHLEPTWYY